MSDRNAAESDSQIAAASTKSSPFKITGRIVGLVPGQQKSLRLKVVNGNRYAIRVKWVAVRANTSTKSGCAVPALELPKRQKMSLRVPARKSAFAVYPIRLKSSIPSECQLAQWPLRYTGQAVRVP